MLLAGIFLIFAIAVFLVVSTFTSQTQRVSLHDVMSLDSDKPRHNSLLTPLRRVSRVLMDKLKMGSGLQGRLSLARVRMPAYEFFAIKLVVGVLLAVGMGILLRDMHLVHSTAVSNVIKIGFPLLIGYGIPDFWLKRRVAKRKAAIVRFLPETIDLMGLCIEAGLDFVAASRWIIQKTKHNAFIEELKEVFREIELGRPRLQALRDMAKRLNTPEVNSFVRTLVQAERMGTPISETFNILSEDMRQARFEYGERQALKAPIKVLIPLIFFILPVIMIIVGGPILIQFAQGSIFNLMK